MTQSMTQSVLRFPFQTVSLVLSQVRDALGRNLAKMERRVRDTFHAA